MSRNDPLTTVYATDEHILIRASADFALLCPEWQKLAAAADGAIDVAAPWILTSASVDFSSAGVTEGHVVLLRRPSTAFKGAGEFLVVSSATGHSLTLRRPGQAVGRGQAPSAVGGIDFLIATLGPQIEEASFDLNRRLDIDPDQPGRSPADVYDPRDLRRACVLSVLTQRYAAEARTPDGDFALKLSNVQQELSDVLARLQLRWGAAGQQQPSTTRFSTRLAR
jgi:hypothetical protein